MDYVVLIKPRKTVKRFKVKIILCPPDVLIKIANWG